MRRPYPILHRCLRRGGAGFLGLLALSVMSGPRAATPRFAVEQGSAVIEAEWFSVREGSWEEVEGAACAQRPSGTSPEIRLLITDPAHPAAAGLRGGVEAGRFTPIPWIRPGPAAWVAVSMGGDPAQAVVAGYERGAPLPGGDLARARRTWIPMPDPAWERLQPCLTAAAAWAAGTTPPAPRQALLLTRGSVLHPAEELLVEVLRAAHLAVETRAAPAFDPTREPGYSLIAVSGQARSAALRGKLGLLDVPLLIAGKWEVAEELGLCARPAGWREGDNAVASRDSSATGHLGYDLFLPAPAALQVRILGQGAGGSAPDHLRVQLGRAPGQPPLQQISVELPPYPAWSPAREPLLFPEAGWYHLTLRGAAPAPAGPARYPAWRVDKIFLSQRPPSSPVAPVVATLLTEGPGPAWGHPPEWRPRQWWEVPARGIVLEAEAIDHGPHWVVRRDLPGFTGEGWLEWQGPDRTRGLDGTSGNSDPTRIRQGPPSDRLILQLIFLQPGSYRLDVRNHHLARDGDNDAWIAEIDPLAPRPPGRLGDSLADGEGFTWLDWGVFEFSAEAGPKSIYLAGRSPGFGVDRIAIFPVPGMDPPAFDRAQPAAVPRSPAPPGDSAVRSPGFPAKVR